MAKVATKHIQALIETALEIARGVDGKQQRDSLFVGPRKSEIPEALERASNLLRHAAEELEDERQVALGWWRV